MIRLKTYDSTGVAPNGTLYAGDLNALEDAVAALDDLTQNIRVGTLAIGEAGLQIIRYGAGEARLSGALRTDGILRALGGLYAGGFTNAQRDAIPSGSRPYGLVILNSEANRLEQNLGSDASPSWQPVAPTSFTSGMMQPWPGPSSTIPAGWILCDGRELSQATYAALYAALGGASTVWNTFGGLSAPSAGNFRVPDFRGVGWIGVNNMNGGAAPALPGSRISGTGANVLGALMGVENVTLGITQIPSHDHGAVTGGQSVDHTHTITTGNESVDHTHSGTTAAQNVDHTHTYSGTTSDDSPDHTHTLTGPVSFPGPNGGPSAYSTGDLGTFTTSGASTRHTHTYSGTTAGMNQGHTHTFTSGGRSAAHTHSGTTSNASVGHSHAITAQGGGGSHTNMHPVAVLNVIIKT